MGSRGTERGSDRERIVGMHALRVPPYITKVGSVTENLREVGESPEV
jgi:hypothetical protein